MHDLEGCFDVPDPDHKAEIFDVQYSFKENSPLHELLAKQDPVVFRNLGFYRLNYILIAIYKIIRRDRLYSEKAHLVVCNDELERALNRRWFRVNLIKQIVLSQLDKHVKSYWGGRRIYDISYQCEINIITSMMGWSGEEEIRETENSS